MKTHQKYNKKKYSKMHFNYEYEITEIVKLIVTLHPSSQVINTSVFNANSKVSVASQTKS